MSKRPPNAAPLPPTMRMRTPDGTILACRIRPAVSGGSAAAGPGVLFCGGFRSDMTGRKAQFLDAVCARRGLSFACFDYRGCGASEGRFEDGGIGAWFQDALAVLDAGTTGPQVIVGSAMGGDGSRCCWRARARSRCRPWCCWRWRRIFRNA